MDSFTCLPTKLSPMLLSFLNSIERIGDPDYTPSEQDNLRVHRRVRSLTEKTFLRDNRVYKVCHLGSQYQPKITKNALNAINENANSVIVLVDISEYDKDLMPYYQGVGHDSLTTYYERVCDAPHLAKTSVILLLNKVDIFESKLRTSPVKKLYHDYEGGSDRDAAKSYFAKKFLDISKLRNRDVTVCFTNCVDGASAGNLAFEVLKERYSMES